MHKVDSKCIIIFIMRVQGNSKLYPKGKTRKGGTFTIFYVEKRMI